MKALLYRSSMLGALLLLAACGSSGSGTDEPPGATGCRETITGDLTIGTVLHNGPEACDYYFPGGDVGDSTYRITNEVRIEAGTTLRFGPNALLMVRSNGSLLALGTQDARITFEGEQATDGYWDGICFQENRTSRIAHADIRSAGNMRSPSGTSCKGAIAGSYPAGEPVHITDTTVAGSYVNGLSAHNLILGEFADNAFFGNREFGVVVPARQVLKLDVESDYLGADHGAENGKPYVYAGGHIRDPDQNHIWNNLNAPYFVAGDMRDYGSEISADRGTVLVITAGTTIVFDGDSELYVSDGASLALGGTAADRVTLTGVQAERGSWNGVTISNSAAILQHVDILWGGRADLFYTGSLYFAEIGDDPNGKIVEDVFIDGSANCALVIEHDDLSLFQQLDVDFGSNNEQDEC